MRQARPGGADGLSATALKIWDTVATVPYRIADRKSQRWGLGGPPDRGQYGDELNITRMQQVCRRRMLVGAGATDIQNHAFLDNPNATKATGTLYVTDSRLVLMGNRHRVQGQWWFKDCSSVRVMDSLDGIEIVQQVGSREADYVLYVPNPYLTKSFQYSMTPILTAMFTAEAAYVQATGGDWNTFLTLMAVHLGSLT